ncbi:glycoside hydrolase family 3 N-terminal domain-containing protein [Streptomyces sp. NBC_01288]|uniref:glycoside hydrolase family 3 N-terminal domain-containing protein n=1 Tax=Streptomyces sp. NBC_01288 TaxID=2903814 RepID=UPI002E100260
MTTPQWAAGCDIDAILAAMTLPEKLAQLTSLWPEGSGPPGETVAPMQDELLTDPAGATSPLEHGVGQFTRPLGSRAGAVTERLEFARALQRDVVRHSRFGIPALVHEECLTGLQLYGAATYPSPLAWGASWDAELVREMGGQIGSTMRRLNIHLGLAPVLDVVRDPRWGRVEECISEDPYLIGVLGTAYVDGLQSAGAGATLKHFLGYSNSRGGRNLAPVHAGPREIAEVFALPFEMVVKNARPSAVMHSYAEIDGIPVAADPRLLTELLRTRWGFEGVVVADYFGVTFLHTLHDVAAGPGDAAVLALSAGIDVELPAGRAYLEPLAELVRKGAFPVELVDRSVRRVLRHKLELGVFAEAVEDARAVDLDPPASRAVARRLAEESVILLSNPQRILPLRPVGRVAVVGPNADSAEAMLGNYSFTNHIQTPPGTPIGIELPTVLAALREQLPDGTEVVHAPGCAVRADEETEAEAADTIAAAVAAAEDADVCVAVVGDRAGLFGRGTVGEGSDAATLQLPGRQRALLDALLGTGTPVVVVLVTGRPYPMGEFADRAAAVVQAFFPGEEGAPAIAGVLTGRVNPSGRLPVSIPRDGAGQPYSYRHPRLGGPGPVSNVDPSPLFAFGHGLSYTTFTRDELRVTADRWHTAGTLRVRCRVGNDGEREGADVVQLYVRDVVASVTRPMRQLLGWARVELAPGAARVVEFTVPADRLGFVGRELAWIVEPGEFEFSVAPSAEATGTGTTIELRGPVRVLTEERSLLTSVRVREDDA